MKIVTLTQNGYIVRVAAVADDLADDFARRVESSENEGIHAEVRTPGTYAELLNALDRIENNAALLSLENEPF